MLVQWNPSKPDPFETRQNVRFGDDFGFKGVGTKRFVIAGHIQSVDEGSSVKRCFTVFTFCVVLVEVTIWNKSLW